MIVRNVKQQIRPSGMFGLKEVGRGRLTEAGQSCCKRDRFLNVTASRNLP